MTSHHDRDAPLRGCTAVVTGASGGSGEATARVLATAGARVAVLARRHDRLDELAADLGGSALVRAVDLTEPGAAPEVVASIVAETGRLDILVNSAGYGSWAAALDADVTDWQRMVNVNLSAVLRLSHAALPHLVEAAGGPRGVADLITVSSVAGRRTAAGNNAYSATKHAVGASASHCARSSSPMPSATP